MADSNQPIKHPDTPIEAEKVEVPSSWPGAFGVYSTSKQIVMFNLGVFLSLFLASIVLNMLTTKYGNNLLIQLIGFIGSLIIAPATILASFAGIDSVKVSLSQTISDALKFVLKLFILTIILGFALAGSLLLFIIPFFFVLPRVALAPYFLIRENLGVTDALQKSWDLSKGHSAKVWGIIGVSILFAFLCIVLIGIYFLFIYQAAFAVLAIYILKNAPKAEKA